MKLKIIGSNSKGNCYILKAKNSSLIVEAGVHIKHIKKALDFDLSSVEGCLVTHSHLDHSMSMIDLAKCGINCYTNKATIETTKHNSHWLREVKPNTTYTTGDFSFIPVLMQHDVVCYAYLIKHDEMGVTAFITDTFYSQYKFSGVNNFILECNYDEDVLRERVSLGLTDAFIKNRVMHSHLSLGTCKKLLTSNDLTKVQKIVLIHLSDGNSDARRFKDEIQDLTGRQTIIADKGVEVNLDLVPF
jgi:phosphoribosyl 1,2-cyclic phosphodiesterase